MAFAVYSLRGRIIFIATVSGESNTSQANVESLMPSSQGHPRALFSQIVGKCTGIAYKGREASMGTHSSYQLKITSHADFLVFLFQLQVCFIGYWIPYSL